jgi:hypothetical protein
LSRVVTTLSDQVEDLPGGVTLERFYYGSALLTATEESQMGIKSD